jgi:hypothetical protein
MKAMTTAEKIKAALARHPDWTDNRVQKSAGGTQALVRAIRQGADPATFAESPRETLEHITGTQTLPILPGGGHGGLVSLSRIVEKFDIRAAILREIAALPEGELIPEKELCQRTAGKDQSRFRRCVENNGTEFKPLRVKARLDDSTEGKWLWGRMKDIEAARAIIES